ncbi:hypothetical protein HXZ93_06785 [Acinetobacter pseudolwoffii]|uniref:hypothetical protein n=1 Tax=Acinetobacter pseudolwoffii TaxID=2053287 RepID=UPI00257595BF|nr:hypothetical protein [Acinetobacter pseudolwoffii]MDM1335740.1 hypothetical protein [Acinetobacter pseudolwoffii]
MLIKQNLINKEIFKYGSIFFKDKNKYKIPSFLHQFWTVCEVNNSIFYIHPDEVFKTIKYSEFTVVIVGEIFVAHSALNLYEIIKEFLLTKNWGVIDFLSGRFNIYVLGESNYVFIDPIGSKTLYYNSGDFDISCNHALLLATILNMDLSPTSLGYKKSKEYNLKGTKFLPGDITMFDGIFGLSPNNYLDFNYKKIVRFYDFSSIRRTELNELRVSVFEYYKNFCEFLNKRKFKPVVGLTAGVDTRLVISAFLFFDVDFELVTWSRGVSNDEMTLIKDISNYLNKKHYYIDTQAKEEDTLYDDLKYLSNYNTSFSRGNCSLTVKFKKQFNGSDNYLFVRGLGGEIIRGMFNKKKSKSKLNDLDYSVSIYNTHSLNKIEKSAEYDYHTKKYIEDYLVRSNIDKLKDCDIGDVIYWEQRMGRWAAELHNENDPAIKNFTGLNSRLIYNIAFGLPDDIRFTRDLLIDLASLFDKKLAKFQYI